MRSRLIPVGSLLASLAITYWCLGSVGMPGLALLAGAVIGLLPLLLSGKAPMPQQLWERGEIINQGLVGTIIVGIWVWQFALPGITLVFVPVWIGLGFLLRWFRQSPIPTRVAVWVAGWVRERGLPCLQGLLAAGRSRLQASVISPVLGTLAALYLCLVFVPGAEGLSPLWLLAVAGWTLLWLLVPIIPVRRVFPVLDGVVVGSAAGLFGGILAMSQGTSVPAFWVWLLWAPLFTLGFRAVLALLMANQTGVSLAAEGGRCALLIGGTLWLMKGFATPQHYGGGDSLWYTTMLADMVAQMRQGVFPVWTGQGLGQFNGAIFPLRIAPAYHYSGGLLDLATLRFVGPFALKNLLLTLAGVFGAGTAYFFLSRLLPGRRGAALLLAMLYVSCPGVLGIPYYSDLYMSWLAFPWVPVALGCALQLGQRPSLRVAVLLALALGLCWWGHSPIALWTTLFVGIALLLAFARDWGNGLDGWRSWVAFAGLFAVIASYPVGSVLLFPTDPHPLGGGYGGLDTHPEILSGFVREAFPQVLLPLSPTGRALSDLQLGYGLWLILMVVVVVTWRRRSRPLLFLTLGAVFLVLLLTPIPWFNLALWQTVPRFIRGPTAGWAMNRLYLLLATLVVFGGAYALSTLSARRGRWILGGLFLLAAWSFREAAKFSDLSLVYRHPAKPAEVLLRSEFVMVTRNAYVAFASLPPRFNHGVVDPELFHTLWNERGDQILGDNEAEASRSGQELTTGELVPDANGAKTWTEARAFVLEPGKHYFLRFEFHSSAAALPAVLVIQGPGFSRAYELPASGEARAFGIGGSHTRDLPVWTSGHVPVSVHVTVIPADPVRFSEFTYARLSFRSYDPHSLPIQVADWIHYRMTVTAQAPGWLETPRMYQPGYQAWVNQRPAAVRKTPEGLVAIAVPAGRSVVELRYVPPYGLSFLFFFSLAGIAAGSGLIGIDLWRRTHFISENSTLLSGPETERNA